MKNIIEELKKVGTFKSGIPRLETNWRLYHTESHGWAVRDMNHFEWRSCLLKDENGEIHEKNKAIEFLNKNHILWHEEFEWTEDKVYQFVNWYVELHRLPFNYTLENGGIIESFKHGDDPKLWWRTYGQTTPTELKTEDEVKGEIIINDILMNLKLLSSDQIKFLIAMLNDNLENLNNTKGDI